jgi:hypothetical protein
MSPMVAMIGIDIVTALSGNKLILFLLFLTSEMMIIEIFNLSKG